MKLLGQMKTDEVWKKFKDQVIFSRKLANEAARRRQEFREMLHEKSKELKETSLPQITEAKIERPQWKEENLGELLEHILKEAEIEYVVAVAEVGLPGRFSNSVAAEIRAIGKLILESRKEEAGEVYFLGLVKDLKERLMMIGKNNPVIKLCIEGTRAEFQGYLDRAHHLYKQAWNAAEDDYEACIAAHYLARGQEDLHKKLHWSQVALEKAIAVGDHRVAAFFSSLYLCLGESYELLGNKNEAQRYYALAAESGGVDGKTGKQKRSGPMTEHLP